MKSKWLTVKLMILSPIILLRRFLCELLLSKEIICYNYVSCMEEICHRTLPGKTFALLWWAGQGPCALWSILGHDSSLDRLTVAQVCSCYEGNCAPWTGIPCTTSAAKAKTCYSSSLAWWCVIGCICVTEFTCVSGQSASSLQGFRAISRWL